MKRVILGLVMALALPGALKAQAPAKAPEAAKAQEPPKAPEATKAPSELEQLRAQLVAAQHELIQKDKAIAQLLMQFAVCREQALAPLTSGETPPAK